MFIISFISSLKFINVVFGGAKPEACPDLTFLKIISASVAAAVLTINSIKTLLANGFNDKPVFINGPRTLAKYYTIDFTFECLKILYEMINYLTKLYY